MTSKITRIDQRSAGGLKPLSSVKENYYEYVWDRRIAVGTIALIAGEEGVGKSTILCQIAAAVTNGTRLPNERDEIAARRSPGIVGWMATEDSIDKVLKQRMTAAGAELDDIFVDESVYRIEPLNPVRFERWIKDLKAEQHTRGRDDGPCLVVMDPAHTYLKGSSNNDTDVTAFMDVLKTLAEKHTIAPLLLRHPNKSMGNGDSSSLILGSRMWRAKPRSVLIVGEAKEHSAFIIVHDKSNLDVKQPTIEYEIEKAANGAGVARLGEVVNFTIHDILTEIEMKKVARPGTREDAAEFLRRELSKGERTRAWLELQGGLRDPAISWRTMRNALKDLGAINRKGTGEEDGKSHWRLPDEEELKSEERSAIGGAA